MTVDRDRHERQASVARWLTNHNKNHAIRASDEFVSEWDVLRDENGAAIILTVKQSQAVWYALGVVEAVRRSEGFRSLWEHPQVDIGKSRLLGRMLLEGLPPTRTKPPLHTAGPNWSGLPGGDPFDRSDVAPPSRADVEAEGYTIVPAHLLDELVDTAQQLRDAVTDP